MTKIGEEGDVPRETTIEQYHRDVEKNASRFLNALESYNEAGADDRARLKPVMDESLQLIRAAVNEIRLAGIYKKEVEVEKDYKAYINNSTPENLSALEEDLSVLRDYNKLS